MRPAYPIIRKPKRRYPLPDNLRELDYPHAECVRRRHARVDRFNDGYDSDEDPLRRRNRVSYDTVLNRM
jgi:hypothetical protein